MIDRIKIFDPVRRVALGCKAARALAFLLLLIGPFSSLVQADDRVIVVDTVDRAAGRQLSRAVEQFCPSCGPVAYRHINGDRRTGRRLAAELKQLEQDGKLSLVITLGKPATNIIADSLRNTPVFYSMVGSPISGQSKNEGVTGFPTDAPVELQVEVLRGLVPGLKNIGIVAGQQQAQLIRSSATPKHGDLKVYEVERDSQLPKTLRQAVRASDALIFVRDPRVINNDSVRFVIQQTLANRVHTFGYSEALVDMGLGFAMVPRPEAFGRRLGEAAERLLKGHQPQNRTLTADEYTIHRNEAVLMQAAERRALANGKASR